MKSFSKNKIIILLSTLLILVILLFVGLLYRDGYFTSLYHTVKAQPYSYKNNAQYVQRETLFEASPVDSADIIFVGDSITARGEWQEFFPDQVVLNRGIDSDVTEGVYNRLDTIIDKNPKVIYLMIGINDIRQGIDPSLTRQFYEGILEKLTRELPDSEINIQSVLPVNSSTGIDNEEVQALNLSIKALADQYSLRYIDLYSLLVDEHNGLPANYSIDGVHMTGEGYQIWIQALQ